MDIKKQEYMLKHDKNIAKMWTERYQNQQKKTLPVDEHMPFKKCTLRQKTFQPGKPSYFILTDHEKIDLNVSGVSSKFARYIDELRTEIMLSHMKGFKLNKYSSEHLRFQLLTIHEYDKLKYTVLVYSNNQICVREPSPQSSDGQVGSWLWDKQQRDIACSIWKPFQ
mgnify:FL=1|tara:strand:- start:1676 stop:2176 length:501 start_codon:yes stop_codon:yes gene_type:complete